MRLEILEFLGVPEVQTDLQDLVGLEHPGALESLEDPLTLFLDATLLYPIDRRSQAIDGVCERCGWRVGP